MNQSLGQPASQLIASTPLILFDFKQRFAQRYRGKRKMRKNALSCFFFFLLAEERESLSAGIVRSSFFVTGRTEFKWEYAGRERLASQGPCPRPVGIACMGAPDLHSGRGGPRI